MWFSMNGYMRTDQIGMLLLVVTQVALSLMLLIGAGLLTTSLARLQDVDLGFEAEDVYTFGVSIPGAQYGWPEEAGQFYRAVEARVAELPGVTSAGIVWPMPFGGPWTGPHSNRCTARCGGGVSFGAADGVP